MSGQSGTSASANEETPYEVFVSYAREDDRAGWVSEIVSLINQQADPGGGPPLRVFFDRQAIQGDQDWRHRILGALRRSKVLLVFLSPAFHRSGYCRWEWHAFQAARSLRKLQGNESASVVRFVAVPGGDSQQDADWIEEIRRQNYLLDLAPWFNAADGLAIWRQEQREQSARLIAERLWQRISDERAAQRAFGNLRGSNRHFVGRVAPLRELHQALCLHRIGMVNAVQGLGGIGKTELAVQYAYEHAWTYTGGIWQLNAEGHKALLPLLASLASNSHFLAAYAPRFTEAEQADAQLLGHAVLAQLARHARSLRQAEEEALVRADCPGSSGGGCAVLLILDNVDQRELLSTQQLQQLPELGNAGDLVRIVATTRLGQDHWGGGRIHVQTLRGLADDEARALFQQLRGSAPQPDADYAAGVERLIQLLGGYTLVVEQVAAYLGMNPGVSPHALAEALQARGLQLADELQARDPRVRDELHHQQALVRAVLEQSLGAFSELERHLLALAAHLPPDHIRWDWLAQMVEAVAPALLQHEAFEPDPLVRAHERLLAAQLLSPTDDAEVHWMHRVVGAHLRDLLPRVADREASAVCLDFIGAAQAFLEHRFDRLEIRPWGLLRALDAVCSEWLIAKPMGRLQALTMSVVASVWTQQGVLVRSERLQHFSLEVLRQLAAANPEDSQAQRDLSLSLNGSARFLLRRRAKGDVEQAWGPLQASLAIRHRQAEANPEDSQAQRDLSVSLNESARFLFRRGAKGDAEQAWGLFQESLAILRRLAEANPEDSQAQRDLMVSLNESARFLLRRGAKGDAEQAWGLLQESLAIVRRLAEANPEDSLAQRDLSVSLNESARFLLRRGAKGDAEQAWGLLQASLAIRRRQAEANPEDSQAQRDLTASLNQTAGFLMRRGAKGDAEQAWGLLQESLAIVRRLVEVNPEDSQAQRDASVSLNESARFLLRRGSEGDAEQAWGLLQESLAIRRRLAEANPDGGQAQRDLSVSLNESASFLLRRGAGGDAEQAWGLLQEDLAIARRLAEANPEDGQARDDVATSLEQLAAASSSAGRRRQALAFQQEAVDQREQLLSREDSAWQTERLARSLMQLGHLVAQSGDEGAGQRLARIVARFLALCDNLLKSDSLPPDLAALHAQLRQPPSEQP